MAAVNPDQSLDGLTAWQPEGSMANRGQPSVTGHTCGMPVGQANTLAQAQRVSVRPRPCYCGALATIVQPPRTDAVAAQH